MDICPDKQKRNKGCSGDWRDVLLKGELGLESQVLGVTGRCPGVVKVRGFGLMSSVCNQDFISARHLLRVEVMVLVEMLSV